VVLLICAGRRQPRRALGCHIADDRGLFGWAYRAGVLAATAGRVWSRSRCLRCPRERTGGAVRLLFEVPCVPGVMPVPGVTDPGAQRQFFTVDPGLAVDRVHGRTPDPPWNPDPPR